MIELKLKKTLMRLDFSFFAVIALFLLLDDSGFGIAALTACALHELSHFIVMMIFGITADKVTFYGAGIRISSAQTERAKPAVKSMILCAGCAANFAAAAVFAALGQYAVSAVNLFTGIFNLLPMGELDGAALLKTAAIRFCEPHRVDRTMRLAAVISASVCAAAAILLGGKASFTLITSALYFIIVGSV